MWRIFDQNAELKRPKPVSTFRKMALGTWDAPRDPQIYGTLTVRMEESLRFIEEFRAATGLRLTVTQLVAKAIGLALVDVPEANAIIRRGRPQEREKVSVFLSIALQDEETGKIDLSGAKIDSVDQKPMAQLVEEVNATVQRVRKGDDPELNASRNAFDRIPFGRATRYALDLISLGLYGLNVDLSRFGLPKDPFGSALVTNIGSLGLSEAYAPLMAYTRTPVLLAVGAVKDAPVVQDGELAVGKEMRVHATLDHRLIDGKHAAVLAQKVQAVLERPFDFLGPVLSAGERRSTSSSAFVEAAS